MILNFLFSPLLLSGQMMPPPYQMHHSENMHFNGRRMQRQNMIFALIGLKIEDKGLFCTLSLYFNAPVDSNSLEPDFIFIDGQPLPGETEFLFNKNRHMVRFDLKKREKPFTLKITKIASFDRRIMADTEFQELQPSSILKYSREERKWQKSSL